MPTEGATHIDDLVTTKPASGEEGNLTDDYLRELKAVIKTDFSAITGPVTASQTELNYLDGATPGTGVASTAVVLDGNLDFNFGAGDISATDITATGALAGASVDGPVGSVTPAAVIGTTLKANTSLELASGATVTGILDEDDMATDSATQLATQRSIKAYVDTTTALLGGVKIIGFGVFDGTGTPAYTFQSGMNSSITDNGTGDYTLTFDSAEADTNYGVLAMICDQENFTNVGQVVVGDLTTTNFNIQTWNDASGITPLNSAAVAFLVFRSA